jgi:hypothetical protein
MINRLALAGVVLLALSGCASKPESAHTRDYTMHLREPAAVNDCINVVETVTFADFGDNDGNQLWIPTTRRAMKAAPCGEGAIPLNTAVISGTVFELAKVIHGDQ